MLVYLAAPLFSEAGCRFNEGLAEGLGSEGFRVFLPQRDGVERDKPPYNAMLPEERRLCMFRLDGAKIFESDVFLFVLDGRMPDEGACVELGIAYCHEELRDPSKLIVGLRTDVRAAFLGSELDPMLRVPLKFVAGSEEELLAFLRGRRQPTGD